MAITHVKCFLDVVGFLLVAWNAWIKECARSRGRVVPLTREHRIAIYARVALASAIGVSHGFASDGPVDRSAIGFICPARPALHSLDV